MKILQELRARAQNKQSKIVLPEANMDERVMLACKEILKEGLSKIVVLGKPSEFSKEFIENENCEIIDIANFESLKDYTEQLFEMRKSKGLTFEDARKLIMQPTYFAMMLVKNCRADGVVAGAKLRICLQARRTIDA